MSSATTLVVSEAQFSATEFTVDVISEFVVLHEGWECDNTGWLVRLPDGSQRVAVTSHGGGPFLIPAHEVQELLQRHHDAYVGVRNAAEAAGVTLTKETPDGW